jgi:hypothetical protein
VRYYFVITDEMAIFQIGKSIRLDDELYIDNILNTCWFVWELGEKLVWCFFHPKKVGK